MRTAAYSITAVSVVNRPEKASQNRTIVKIGIELQSVDSPTWEDFAIMAMVKRGMGVGILPDDLVVVHRQNLAQNGQIVVALLGDEATVKTLKRKGSEVWLMPANPDYQPIDGRECTILGRVVAVVRQY